MSCHVKKKLEKTCAVNDTTSKWPFVQFLLLFVTMSSTFDPSTRLFARSKNVTCAAEKEIRKKKLRIQAPKKSTSSVMIIILSLFLFLEESYNAIVVTQLCHKLLKKMAHHSRIPAAFCKKKVRNCHKRTEKMAHHSGIPAAFCSKN